MLTLVVGLGNIGDGYRHHRHNAGFMLADALVQRYAPPDPRWITTKRALLTTCHVDGQRVSVAKPTTLMNASGFAVLELLQRLNLTPASILVAHDDIDLPLATWRAKVGGGHGGHNGVRHITACIGAQFARLRLGVGRPTSPNDPDVPQNERHRGVHTHVLSNFRPPERATFQTCLQTLIDDAPRWLMPVAAPTMPLAASMRRRNLET